MSCQIEKEVMRCCFQEIKKQKQKSIITLLSRNPYCLSCPSTILYLKFILQWGSVGNIKELMKELRSTATSEILYSALLKAFLTDHKIMQVH